MDLVCDLKAELFTICESLLNDLDSAILSDLTLPGYSKLYHCPCADRRGGGTVLLYRDGLDVKKVFSAERSSFEVSEWLHPCPILSTRFHRKKKVLFDRFFLFASH